MDTEDRPTSDDDVPMYDGPTGQTLIGLPPWVPTEAPEAGAELWFSAARLVPRSEGYGAPALDGPAVKLAMALSRRAAELAGMGEHMAPKAAWLRAQAAERKRIAGAPAEAFEDYEALSRYHLGGSRLKPAIAYMRKALHVCGRSDAVATKASAFRLAAEVYMVAGQRTKALAMARDGSGRRDVGCGGVSAKGSEAYRKDLRLRRHRRVPEVLRLEEIASTVLWLCSPGASFVLGVALPVDGGFVAH